MEKYPHVHSQNLLKLIAIEFKECLLDSPSFRASTAFKLRELKDKYINIDYNTFSLNNLDSWIYSDITDNQIIKIYHNHIKKALKGEEILDKNDIKTIKSLLNSFNNFILDFESYRAKHNELVMAFTSSNYTYDDEAYRKDVINLFTLEIKHLSNSLNLTHQLKNIKVSLNIFTMEIILKLYKKSIQSDDCLIYSESIDQLETLIKNYKSIYDSQQVLNKDININKNLIIKAFKKKYDPDLLLIKYHSKNFYSDLQQNVFRDYELFDFSCWILQINGDMKRPMFIFVKNYMLGIFELSDDGTYVAETDKFGLNVIDFKIVDMNNEENGYKMFSFMLVFDDYKSENKIEMEFQAVTSVDICKLHSVIMNIKDKIKENSLPRDVIEASNKRFSPLFKEFFIENQESPLINYDNKDSVSLLKKVEKFIKKDLSLTVGLRLLNNIDMPITTSFTNLALFANVYMTLTTNCVPNAIIANTWGSEYWANLFMKNKDNYNYNTQLFIKTQSDAAFTIHNVPFRLLFGYIQGERAYFSLNCYLHFTQTDKSTEDGNVYFKGSMFVTHKKLYFYLSSYGLISLFSISLEDILDIQLIKGKNQIEPLEMIIYDKQKLNVRIRINFTKYFKMDKEYVVPKESDDYFKEVLSLLSIKEKILFLIDANHQSLGKKAEKSGLIQQRSVKDDENTIKALHAIDYRYFLKNQTEEKLIFFKNNALNGQPVYKNVEEDVRITHGIDLNNGIDIIQFKTSISTKHTMAKIHKLEVPIKLDALGLLFLGRRNVFARNLYKEICHINTKRGKDEVEDYENGTDSEGFAWAKDGKFYSRSYKAILRERRVFYSDEATPGEDVLNTNEIFVKDKLLQYKQNENFIIKMEFGDFEIPLTGVIRANLYFIVERLDSKKSMISFYFEVYPLEEIHSSQYLKRLLFEILNNYLYKKHLKSLMLLKLALGKYYKNMGKGEDQYIKCLKISSTIDIERPDENLDNIHKKYVRINRMKLVKLIVTHYIMRIGLNTCMMIKKIYFILGTLITNIVLINRTLMIGLIISVLLNVYLINNDFFKTWFLARKLNNVMPNDVVIQRSLSLTDLDALMAERSFKLDKDNVLLNNFVMYTADKTAYQEKRRGMGFERNQLLVNLDVLNRKEQRLIKEEYSEFIRAEAKYCKKYEQNKENYGDFDLTNYCDDVVDNYISIQLL